MSASLRSLSAVPAASLLFAGCALVTVANQSATPGGPPDPTAGRGVTGPRASGEGRLPIVFIENRGQVDARVRFYARSGRQTLWLTDEGIVFDLLRARRDGPAPGTPNHLRVEDSDRLVFRQRLLGANPSVAPAAQGPRPGTSNFLVGTDPAGWRTGVPSYGEVVYPDIYPGIDLRLYANGRALEQEFVVHPEADPGRIWVAYEGVGGVRAAADGGLRIRTEFGEVRESAPRIYQEVDGTRIAVTGRFEVMPDGSYRFAIGPYRPDAPLVIDPTLEFSTYLGGSSSDVANDVAVDPYGNVYVTGQTFSSNFPVVVPLQETCIGCSSFFDDVFVTKIDAAGNVVYSTYLGGSNVDRGLGIAVDGAGNAFVVGYTQSTNFPRVSPLQTALAGLADAFVVQINPPGSALVYSTYLGGSGTDYGHAIAVDTLGNAYVTGVTNSSNFPRVSPVQPTCDYADDLYNGDVFVSQIGAFGAPLAFSTCVGGSFGDEGNAIAVDDTGHAYVAGTTQSPNFPTAPAGSVLQPALADVTDAFVMKIDVAAATMVYSTYLGGHSGELASGITVDGTGAAYVTGATASDDFPLAGVARPFRDGVEAFLSKLNSTGTALVYSTYHGGSGDDYGAGVAVDALGFAHVAGSTTSPDFPLADPLQTTSAGSYDAFVTKFGPDGANLAYSTFLGGTGEDRALGIALNAVGDAYVTGYTESGNFPLANPVQAVNAGGVDAFIAKISADRADLAIGKSDAPDPVVVGNPLTYTITVTNNGPSQATGVVVTDSLVASASFVSATPSQGSCAATAAIVTCDVGTLASGSTATIIIVVTPTAVTTALLNTAGVTASEPDPVQSDNTATTATIVSPAVDLAPDISASPVSLDFGAIAIGAASAPLTVTIRNDGTAGLSVGSLAIFGADAPDFTLATDACSGQSLAPDASCTAAVVFSPSREGGKNAVLSIPSNDPDENPLVVPLTGTGTQATGEDYRIQFHSRTFVPPAGMSAETRSRIVGLGLPRAHVLLQTMGIPTSQERTQLTTLGVRLLVYIPNFAWLASVPTAPAAVDAIAAHPAVRAVVHLVPDDRTAVNVKDGIDPRLRYPDGSVALEVVSHSDVAMTDARSVLVASGAAILEQSEPIHAFVIRVDPAAVAALSQSDLLLLISEVAPPAREDNDQVRLVTKASNVQIVQDTVDGAGNMTGTQPGLTYALDGAGVLIGQWEPLHPDCSHPDFQGLLDATGAVTGTNLRLTFGDAAIDCRSPSYTAAGDPTIGDHATHVAGIVLGNGSQSVVAGGLALQWRGMAPNASIVAFQRPRLDPDGDGVADGAQIATHRTQYDGALAAGMLLSTNSWGFTHCHQVAGTCYETASVMYDDLITDAANPERNNAIAILGSAGNEGPTATDGAGNITGAASFSVRIPNSAKNTIVVGNLNANTLTLTGTSSRGPVDDGRIKPDVVAPGDQAPGGDATRIRSTVMTITTDDAGANGNPQGSSCTSNGQQGDGTDDCAFPYDDLGGTSMSTPAAAGAAALIAQQFRTRGADPWPSTIKALLVHTAVDQCCADSRNLDGDTPGPDYAFGYGLIDVQRALDVLRNNRNGHVVQAGGFGGWGSCLDDAAVPCDVDGDGAVDDQIYRVNLPPNRPAYRVTLVYDDLSGGGGVLARGAAALRNDLDLFLVAPDGSVFRPWVLDPANPTNAATTDVDKLNPVEVVDVANPAGGQWTIVVRPTRLIPFDLEPPQRYTLVYESFEPDVMIRDRANDDGGVPSVRYENGVGWTPARYWRSPDVTLEGDEAITPGVERFVRVVVTNRGQTTVNDVTVQLYWAPDGVGVDYADYLARPMGSCVIPSIDPDQRSNPADCRIAYTWAAGDVIVGEDGKTHVCLLATVEVNGDPLTYPGNGTLPDGANPASFVPWDDNIAQQNVVYEPIGPGGDGTFDFQVTNPSDTGAIIEIEQDASRLPAGWQVVITPSPFFTLAPGQRAFGRVTLVPPMEAPVGSRAEVSFHGRVAAIGGGNPDPSNRRTGGFDAVVVVVGGASEARQSDALRRLESVSLRPSQIRLEAGIPRFVDVRVPVPSTLPDDPVLWALEFLYQYRDLYRLDDPAGSFFLARIASDPLTEIGGGTPDPSGRHLFFGQHRDGIPVFASTLAVHLRGNQVTGTHGNYLPRIPDLPPAELTALQAEAIARSSTSGQNVEVIGQSRLMYFNRALLAIGGGGSPDPGETPTQLAWRVMTSGLRDSDGMGTSWMHFVDASNGTVLHTLDQSREHGKDFDIETANNTTSASCWNAPFITDDDEWFDEDGPVDGYPGEYPGGDVDGDNAFAFTHRVYDYFHNVFGRHSYDNDFEQIVTMVHVGNNWRGSNYSWSPWGDCFSFGDGYAVLDVVAHEFTHGMDASRDDGGLVYENQSGALNESYADFFGAMVDGNWTIAEDRTPGGNPANPDRDMSNPPAYSDTCDGTRYVHPDHMDDYRNMGDCDNGGIHINSGIPNKAAFLVTDGGVHSGIEVRGIGRDKARRLYYDVHGNRLSDNDRFMDAREQTIAQAEAYVEDGRHRFTTADVCSVMNAFAAVGLGSADVDCDGTPDEEDENDDGDWIPDAEDNCPGVPNGFQEDLDEDGTGDACDTDVDGDGVSNFSDVCPLIANADQADADGDGIGDACEDDDGDTIPNPLDNCPATRNRDQIDLDDDGVGDACDNDRDGDGVPEDGDGSGVVGDRPCRGWGDTNCDDNCPLYANRFQDDQDGDGHGDGCDNCRHAPNPGQEDTDRDGLGDACDADDDNDGVADDVDVCQWEPDPDQLDPDQNGVGLACDAGEAFLYSGDWGAIVTGVLSFRDLATPLRIPIAPCLVNCPDWITEDYETQVALQSPVAVRAAIVDDRGFAVRKGTIGVEQTLRFHPAADSFFRAGAALLADQQTARSGAWEQGNGATALDSQTTPSSVPAYRGRRYFLQLMPTEQTQGGTTFSAAIRVTSGLRDLEPPELTNWPADPSEHEATGPDGAMVSYVPPTGVDAVDPDPAVACVPASGSVFALGTTVVTCTATDDAGNESAGTFRVIVRDTTPPTVTPPADVTVPATEAAGAKPDASAGLAAFLAGGTALDLVDIAPSRLTPQVNGVEVNAGTLFPVGTTPVTFRFGDESGNIGVGTANATVIIGLPLVSARIVSQGNYTSDVLYVDVQLTNDGTGHARSVGLERLWFFPTGGGRVSYNTALSPALPYQVGSLDVGAAATVRLYLNVSRNVSSFFMVEYGTHQDVTGTLFPFLGLQTVTR